MRIYCVQHMQIEGPGLIRAWAESRGHTVECIHLYAGGDPTVITPGDRVVIMGGAMGVDDRDRLPWLDNGIRWLSGHLAAGGAAFGVCLGAQVIAAALGAQVRRNPSKEIGWMSVHFRPEARAEGVFANLPAEMIVMHWHGDTFAIPEGAQHAAYSEGCHNQAFAIGHRVIALQFHLEAEPGLLEGFLDGAEDELTAGGPFVQDAAHIRVGTPLHAPQCQAVLYTLLDRWIGTDSVTSQPDASAACV